jgi:hypothetical protein
MSIDEEKLANCKRLIRFFLKQSIEYLDQAKFHCDLIYPHWTKIEEKIIGTQKSIEEILEDSNKVN